MCGIIGYLGRNPVRDYLCRGIELVQYRGYDSAGAVIVEAGRLEVEKYAGDPELTIRALQARILNGTLGLAHTRWATHGGVLDRNAHPHLDCSNRIAVVHNGMLWNHEILRRELISEGHRFSSDTDTECMAHLIEKFRRQGDSLLHAVQKTARLLKDSAFAIAVIDTDAPDELVGACQGGELYVGLAEHGMFLASDHRAFREQTTHSIKVDNGMVVHIQRDQPGPRLTTFNDESLTAEVEELWYSLDQLSMGQYAHHMLAEIMYQGTALEHAIDGRIRSDNTIHLGVFDRQPAFRNYVLHELRRVLFLACGTSNYAGDAAARLFQSLGFEATSMNAGEFVTSPMRVSADTFVAPISQSGTTRETILAAERAAESSARIFPIVNVPGSTLSRLGQGSGMYVQAGLETAVASTKAFTGQILNAAILGHALAELRGTLTSEQLAAFCIQARQIPKVVSTVLANAQSFIDLGASVADAQLFLYLGKGYGMVVAQEGALKLKEVAYKSAFGLSASDLKHGPLAMLDGQTVVLAVCLPDEEHSEVYDWTISNVQQVLSRRGRVIVICHDDDQIAPNLESSGTRVMAVIRIPPTSGVFTAITAVIPLQLFAYGLALKLAETNPDVTIDKPRHIAKVSTVL